MRETKTIKFKFRCACGRLETRKIKLFTKTNLVVGGKYPMVCSECLKKANYNREKERRKMKKVACCFCELFKNPESAIRTMLFYPKVMTEVSTSDIIVIQDFNSREYDMRLLGVGKEHKSREMVGQERQQEIIDKMMECYELKLKDKYEAVGVDKTWSIPDHCHLQLLLKKK